MTCPPWPTPLLWISCWRVAASEPPCVGFHVPACSKPRLSALEMTVFQGLCDTNFFSYIQRSGS